MPDQTFLDSTELVLNMGPQHPSTHGVLRVILKLDGEKVLGADCVIGYLHRGVEKIGENRTYQQFAPYVDRMDYCAAVSNGLGYCLAVEKLLNVEAPPRAQAVRVVLTELNRIASHLIWLGTHALDIGAITPLFYVMREREEILNIFEKYCGARLTTHAFRIGGLQYETYDGLEQDVKAALRARAAQDRRVRAAAHREPHLDRPAHERGHPERRRLQAVRRHRPHAARGGREVGPAQGPALLAATSSTISRSPPGPTATPTTGTWCAWKRCGNRCASSARRWRRFRKDPSWPRSPR